MADDLSAIEPWIGGLIAQLAPAGRRKLAMKLGRLMRKTNAARIARNVEPDGSAMAPRKKRAGRRIKGKMFPRLKLARSHKIRATPDGVTLSVSNSGAAHTAEVHHFGEVGFVGRTRRGETIRARYAARRIYGFAARDIDLITDEVLKHLSDA